METPTWDYIRESNAREKPDRTASENKDSRC